MLNAKKAFLMVVTLLLMQLHVVTAARVLALLPTPSPSHHIWNRSLMLALAARGHHVTVVSPDPEKQPILNHRDIVIEDAYTHSYETYDYEALSRQTILEMAYTVFDWGTEMCKQSLSSNGAKQLIELSKNETFDLIIVESAVEDCFLGFVPKFGNPPVIAITAFGIPPWSNSLVGNYDNAAHVSDYLLPFTDHMTFLQRICNFLYTSGVKLYRSWIYLPAQDKIVHDILGNSIPSITEIEKNISLVMVNAHHGFDFPRPMVPAIIPVAGMHLKPSKPLPKDLQKFLDEAKDGAIYFSLGSNVRSDQMKPEKRQAFLDAFSQLPQRVLWKWESNSLPGQPKNVKLGKWLPQNDILAHPNVRLFITHSGMLSTQESLYHGVPMIGMPFLGDQYKNIAKVVAHGVGEKLDYNTITKEIILDAVQKVVNNPSYMENVKKLSAIFRDQPETPLERAVYWTEYVIRHGGATHLRSAALDLQWYQYLLLDVIAVLSLGILSVLIVVYLAIRKIYCSLVGTKKDKKLKSN